MPEALTDKQFNGPKIPSTDEDVFVPINADWRKKYYKRVWNKRLYAYLLDSIFSIFFMIPGFFLARWIIVLITNLINKIHGPFVPFSWLLTIINYSLTITTLLLIIFFMYAPLAIMESSKWKGTIGKLIMKVVITDDYGNRISFWKSFWRICLKSLFFYSYFLIIPAVVQYFTFKKTKKLFHDYYSKTIIGERL